MTTGQDQLLAAIQQATTDLRVQLAMVFGSMEEGGASGPWGVTPAGPSVGDYGHSYGPFQINLPYHPGVTAAEAANPSFAVQYMEPAYQKAAAKIPASLWRSDPAMAAEETAVAAERPAQAYVDSRGQDQVRQTYARAANLLGGSAGATGGTGAVGSGVYAQPPGQQPGVGYAQNASLGSSLIGGTALSFLNPLAGVFGAGGIQDMVERGALIILGALLMIVGLIMLVKDTSAGQAAVSGAKDAGLAAVVA